MTTTSRIPHARIGHHRRNIIPGGPSQVDAARVLVPEIRALGDRIEQERRLPVELVERLRQAGLFRMAVPRAFGGAEADPITVARVVEELARADASTAWCVMLAAQVASGAGFLPEAGAREVFGDLATIVAGVLRPVGRAVPVAGGYRVTGRWPFASGSSHATWLGGECVIMDGETPRRDGEERLISLLMFFPREAVTIHDTWETLGLRGTASNDFSVEDAFVPAQRSYRVHVAPPVHPGPLYRAMPLAYITHGSHALGIVQAAFETVTELVGAKVAHLASESLGRHPRVQAQAAEAQALIESARQYLYGAAGELWTAALAGGAGTPEQRARVRLATSHAARSAVQAMDLLTAITGTSAIFTRSPLERQHRDLRTAAAHVMVGPATYEASGRAALGMEPNMPFF